MKICFFGVGGVGGYFGALVTKKFGEKHDIFFVARGPHEDTINSQGLTLKKSGGEELINVSPKLCTNNVGDLPICDIIVLLVKAYDLESAIAEIAKISNEETVILPLLNGVDIYEKIRSQLDTGVVFPSCIYVGTHIESPGVIYQKGGSCKISLGKDPMYPEFYPRALLSLLNDSSINFNWENPVQISIWSKYMFIAAFGLVTAAYGKTLGEVLDSPELSELTKSIMNEVEEIAKKLDINLDNDIVETSLSKAKGFPYEAKTSFQRDVELKGEINEGDLFGGTLIRYGKELNVTTPNTEIVYTRLLNK
ncbi:ketopantoate reductase family protein [Methanolobus halotolerans]|uniref:2-dehydropantoate 2-reductase n=1 Tax=Methanolobus halotolerans TaxID=2052935 RepID=A0A4E0PWP0_9EURY|nr:2-dehydropantoate 2-reductase [Methanolobus halotolerans]TGC09801.1 2-dehydropantoate 2-reductase [Methanolobus halotolerans]